MGMLRTLNQMASIASKLHYLNGGNASKILAKDKKGIFTLEQVAETLNCDPVELKTLLQQNGIMCGDYVINESWGDGKKLSTYALRTLSDKTTKKQQSVVPSFLKFKQPQPDQKVEPWANIVIVLFIISIVLFSFDYELLGIATLLIMVGVMIKPACKQIKEQHPEFVNELTEFMNKPIVATIINVLKVITYIVIVGLSGILVGAQLNCFPITFGIWAIAILIPVVRHYKK